MVFPIIIYTQGKTVCIHGERGGTHPGRQAIFDSTVTFRMVQRYFECHGNANSYIFELQIAVDSPLRFLYQYCGFLNFSAQGSVRLIRKDLKQQIITTSYFA